MLARRLFILAVVAAVFLGACGKKEEAKKPVEEKKEVQQTMVEPQQQAPQMQAGGAGALPQGHPSIGDMPQQREMPVEHPKGVKGKAEKPVRISEAIKAKWKVVDIEVADSTARTKDVVKVSVGVKTPLKDTGYAVKVEAFVPDYTMMENAIESKSAEPNNPAVLVELSKGDKVVARGWVFKKFPTFNSYSNERFTLALLTPVGK
ncbi:MAG: hypothetical protein HY890_07780 [Deltaproteobacteria bacterium]|nr:hypothetical protein [Deltaproteobacteria bacterium]